MARRKTVLGSTVGASYAAYAIPARDDDDDKKACDLYADRRTRKLEARKAKATREIHPAKIAYVRAFDRQDTTEARTHLRAVARAEDAIAHCAIRKEALKGLADAVNGHLGFVVNLTDIVRERNPGIRETEAIRMVHSVLCKVLPGKKPDTYQLPTSPIKPVDVYNKYHGTDAVADVA